MQAAWRRGRRARGAQAALDPDGLQDAPLTVAQVAREHQVAGLLGELAEEVREVRLAEGEGGVTAGPSVTHVQRDRDHNGQGHTGCQADGGAPGAGPLRAQTPG